jgi:hypothetical protein
MNVSKQSTKDTASPANASATATSTQRVLHLLWEAMPFLDAIGDSFRVLADDPTDDVASRAVIPAHVKSLLEEAVIEIGELEQVLLSLHDPSTTTTTGHSNFAPNVVRDGNAVVYRVCQPRPEEEDEVPEEATLSGTQTEREMSLKEVLRGTGVVPAQ